MSFIQRELPTNLLLLTGTAFSNSLREIKRASLAYCLNESLRGKEVAGYKTLQFKVSALKWPELLISTVWVSREERNKSNWWGGNPCKTMTSSGTARRISCLDFLLLFWKERVQVSGWKVHDFRISQMLFPRNEVCYWPKTLIHLSSFTLFVYFTPLLCIFCLFCFLTKSHRLLFLLTKTQPLFAKPGGIVLL